MELPHLPTTPIIDHVICEQSLSALRFCAWFITIVPTASWVSVRMSGTVLLQNGNDGSLTNPKTRKFTRHSISISDLASHRQPTGNFQQDFPCSQETRCPFMLRPAKRQPTDRRIAGHIRLLTRSVLRKLTHTTGRSPQDWRYPPFSRRSTYCAGTGRRLRRARC